MGEKVDFSLPSDVPFHMQVLTGCGTPVLTHPGQVRLGDRDEVSLVLGLVHQPLRPHTVSSSPSAFISEEGLAKDALASNWVCISRVLLKLNGGQGMAYWRPSQRAPINYICYRHSEAGGQVDQKNPGKAQMRRQGHRWQKWLNTAQK